MIGRVMRVKDLAGLLRDELGKSDLMPGSPIASAREISEKYDTSVLTAHRAINILEEEGLLYRVQGSGSFIAEKKVAGKSMAIGLCFSSPQGDPAATYAAFDIYEDIISAKLRKEGHNVNRFSYRDLTDAEYMTRQLNELDGVIVASSCIDEKTAAILEQAGLPVVEVQHEYMNKYAFHQVIPHLLPGFKEMLKHLQEAGHEKFVIAAFTDTQHQARRIKTIYEAAKLLGIDPDCFKEVYVDSKLGDTGRMSGQELGEKILVDSSKTLPAIISVSDFIAFGIMDIILRKSLKPGTDVTLVSYDDLESDGFLPFDKPVISSISNHKKTAAVEAVTMLFDAIASHQNYTRMLRIPTSFTARKSSTGKEGS